MPFSLSLPTKALIVLAGALLLFGSGVYFGDEWAEGRHAKTDLKTEQDYSKSLLQSIAEQRAINAVVTSDLEDEKRAREQQKSDFERRLTDAPRETLVAFQDFGNDPSLPQEPAAVRDAMARSVRLSAVSCRLWNAALAQGRIRDDGPLGTAGDDACTGPVEIEDALDNLGQVAELLGQCRAREREAHVFYRRQGLTP